MALVSWNTCSGQRTSARYAETACTRAFPHSFQTVILGVWDGYSLTQGAVPQASLQPYIDDVINELHFLLDASTTTWGALRAKYGRTDPYVIPYVEMYVSSNS